jgi:hypothetical protein
MYIRIYVYICIRIYIFICIYVLDAGKPSKPKKDKVTGKESNRGFVERALIKMQPDRLPCKKTPGVVLAS